ncbi:MAG: GNAT family N-acetyltransferase [Bacteroidales bacterium]|nr:GNAT family N-acetyltransferase [Candidatus Cryptobacteroides equifaecalis]
MNSDIQITTASIKDIPLIRSMADDVFRATYKDIISPSQMEYMMQWMYSEESLEKQICGDGKAFFIARKAGEPCGYVSVEFERMLEDGRKLFHLQKIYVLPAFQGSGVGQALFNHIPAYLKTICTNPFRIELNVNRNNRAVSFYERMGMTRDRQGDFPIGDGFFMTDYIYALDINDQEIHNQ